LLAAFLRTKSHEFFVKIRLTRKLATVLNGVDLSPFKVGDVFRLPEYDAMMLVLEGWAELVHD
jgi:hypothetical protein